LLNIEDKIEALKGYFFKQENILAVWIVGSYGTEFQREDSDVDFAILYDKDIKFFDEMTIAGHISEILKFDDVDVINLKNAPLTLQFRAIKDGRSLYESDYIKVSDYIEMVLKRYQCEKYYIDIFDSDYFGSSKGDVSL